LIAAYSRSKTYEFVNTKVKVFNEKTLKERKEIPGEKDSEE